MLKDTAQPTEISITSHVISVSTVETLIKQLVNNVTSKKFTFC